MNPSRRAEKAQQNWWSIRVKIEGAFDRRLRARSEGNSLLKVDRSRLRELPSKRHPNTASKSRPKRHERTSAEMAVEATAQISTLVRVSALPGGVFGFKPTSATASRQAWASAARPMDVQQLTVRASYGD